MDTLKKVNAYMFPAGYKAEALPLLKVAWPVIVTSFLLTLLLVINTAICGHLGVVLLGAVALANSMITYLGLEIGFGLTTACDTLFSQAFGGNNKLRIGMLVQRSFYIMFMFVFPLGALYVNMEPLFILLGQDPEVSWYAANYLIVAIPALFFYYGFMILSRYTQTQNVMVPAMIIALVGNIISLSLNYVAIHVMQLSIVSSAAAFDIAVFTMLILAILHIWLSKFYVPTWAGWSVEALFGILAFLKLAIFGILMVCLEPLLLEISLLIAGYLGTTELGAQSVLVQYEALTYSIPVGIQVAVSVRIGQHAGAGDVKGAWTTMWVALSCAPVIGVVIAIFYISLAEVLPYLFTSDDAVADMATSLMPLLAGMIFLDLINAALIGTVRGFGKQYVGALVCFVGTYLVNLPIALALIHGTDVSIAGIWWGFIVGLTVQIIIYLIYLLNLNWSKATEAAQEEVRLASKNVRTYSLNSEERVENLAKRVNSTGVDDALNDVEESRLINATQTDSDTVSWNGLPDTTKIAPYDTTTRFTRSQIIAGVTRAVVIYTLLILLLTAAFIYHFVFYQHDHACPTHDCSSNINETSNSTASYFSSTITAIVIT